MGLSGKVLLFFIFLLAHYLLTINIENNAKYRNH